MRRKAEIFSLIVLIYILNSNFTFGKIYDWTYNNKITPLENNTSALQRKVELINQAKHHIHIINYHWVNDETGRAIAYAVRKASERGVKVRVIVGYLPSISLAGDPFGKIKKMLRYPLNDVVKNAPEYIIFSASKLRDEGYKYSFHEKLIVIDGKLAIVADKGFGDVYQAYRGFDFEVEGPIVNELQLAFKESWDLAVEVEKEQWLKQKNEEAKILHTSTQDVVDGAQIDVNENYFPVNEKVGNINARVIHHNLFSIMKNLSESTPLTEEFIKDDIVSRIGELVDEGAKNIKVYSLFPILSKELRKTYKKFLQNNSNLEMITNGLASYLAGISPNVDPFVLFNKSICNPSSIEDKILLIENNAKLYEWQPINYPYSHVKHMIIDNDRVIFGSHNFNLPGTLYNSEIAIEAVDYALAGQLTKYFEKDLKESTKLILIENLRNNSYIDKLLKDFGPFFMPLF